MEGNLKENGWFLSSEGIAECKKACMKENPSTSECLKAAANLDLRVYGTKFLPEDINKRKIDSIKGPGVLQIQKLRNASAPRSNEESSHAPRLLKFYLTDGPSNCQGLEYSTISNLSLSTPPGTKICLMGSVPVRNGMLLLDDENTKVIGGEVESLMNKWKLNKSLAKHSRITASTEGGPPPFVPFNHGRSRDDNRGKGNYRDDVQNGHEEQSDNRRNDRYRQDNPPRRGRDNYDRSTRPRGGDSYRGRDSHDNFDSSPRPRGGDSFRGRGNQDRRNDNRSHQRDDNPDRRNDNRSYQRDDNPDRRSDNRSYQRDDRGNRDARKGNRNFEPSVHTNGGDRYNQRRTDHNRTDKTTKPTNKPADTGSDSPASRSRSGSGIRENGTSDVTSHDNEASNRTVDGPGRGGRGGTRSGRGGRREALGRGRSNSVDQDDSDEYRARQPSDKGTLWDFVKLTIKTPSKPTTPPPTDQESKETEEQKEQETTIEPTTPEQQTTTATTSTTTSTTTTATETTVEDVEQQTEEQLQESTEQTTERTTERPDNKKTRPDSRPTNQPSREQQKQHIKSIDHRGKDQERTPRHQDSFSGPSRDHKQRSYQQRQQHSGGQGRGRGPRGKHDEGRSYNQSLPPRLQKRQQQQYQQQQHFMPLDRDTRDKSSSPGSGSSSDTHPSQSPGVESNQSPQSRSSDDSGQQRQQQQRRQKNYPRQQQLQLQQQHQQQQARHVEIEQQAKQSQYDAQTVQSNYLQTQQPAYPVEQQQLYEHHETSPMMQPEYSYQQTPHPPAQQYPVYQMQTQMGPPQAVMVTQPITSPSQQHIQTPITTAQIRWKKGNQCLALRRDGQYYSAKIEHVTPDGQQCMVSFQDFHGGCEMTYISSLRPFPIIAWTEPNAQSHPATTMTPVPIYAQPTQVAMVPRPQVMVPMQAQPQAYMGPKGPIASPSNVHPPQGLPQPPPGMQWQPAPVGYHDLRTQPAYQPAMIHYDPMMQTTGGVRPAYYPIPPAGTVQFVRGIKELHGQDLYTHQPAGPRGESTADNSKK